MTEQTIFVLFSPNMDIDVVVLSEGSAGALGATLDVFSVANELGAEPQVNLRTLSPLPNPRLRGGLSVSAESLEAVDPAKVVLVLGAGCATTAAISNRLEQTDASILVRWLRRAHLDGAEIAASCTGVFLLGAAGLLDGRRCTTTWWMTRHLQSLFPLSKPGLDAMVVEDDHVWTAGAAFAQIDLCLALLSSRYGPDLSRDTARRLLAEQRVSQAQYTEPSQLASGNTVVEELEAIIQSRLDMPLTLPELAAALAIGQRTLDRRVRETTGLSPMRFVQKVKLAAALEMLRTSELSNDAIADRIGFADAAGLYRLVVRHTGQPPGAFRTNRSNIRRIAGKIAP